MKIIGLVNSKAGSVGPHGHHNLRAALARSGHHHVEILEFDRSHSASQLEHLRREAPDLLIAWGGDGTHRSVLEALGTSESRILNLPGGTMNLLTKWIHGDRPWSDVLSTALETSVTRMLPGGTANGSLFFCAMVAGIPARFAEAREDVRRGDLGRALQDTGAALDGVRTIHLATSYGEDRSHADHHFHTGNVIGALVGPLALNGRMEVARAALPSAVSVLEFAWTTFVSNWRNQPGVTMHPAESLFVESTDGSEIPAMVDGENIAVGPSLEVSFVENAAACLVAARTA